MRSNSMTTDLGDWAAERRRAVVCPKESAEAWQRRQELAATTAGGYKCYQNCS
jgi:hypothetical protein